MRSHVLGGAASSSSRGPGTGTAPTDGVNTEKPEKPKRPSKQKSLKESSEALLKKAAVKVDEGEGIGSLLRRSGVYLGLHMSW